MGQAIVESKGYIAVNTNGAYNGTKPAGRVRVEGSSAVAPVMEKLIEAYGAVNPNATVEMQQNASTTGMNSAIDGICEIGMASRELKSSELEKGLIPTEIAIDGIAVVVNPQNAVKSLTMAEVCSIYIGETLNWSQLG